MTAPDGFWSTKDAGPGMGLSYWIEAICEAFLEMKADGDRENFAAQLTKFQFGPIDLNFVDTDPQEVWRTRAAIARSRENFFYLLYMHGGHMRVAQGDREAVIAPGNCLLVNSREPYRFSLPDRNHCLSVQIPQRWLRTWLPHADDATIITLADHSPWGATLASALGNLRRDSLDRIALPFGVVADQIGAMLALATGKHEPMTPQGASLLRRLTRTIAEQSSDPAIDPASIAAAHGISKRYLHLVLAQGGLSFGAVLIETRLNRAKALLEDRRFARIPIADIAWRSGFSNPSHFARRFRQRFGSAPGYFRRTLRS
ncbi:helix-turn-helix domain-containing protein [Pseudorhodoplanes sp.]|uniref:helix-turn-helix domain-containing protein n=1 Tax=Pseudorhodoplanes sp. TaxID=1934341 RepID=UPI003D0A418A